MVGVADTEGAEEAARMSEAICTEAEGDEEAEAVRERSAFDSGPGALASASAPASNPDPGPDPEGTPFVAGEVIV